MDLFGKKKTPEECTKEWIRDLKHEQRQIERSIRKANLEVQKLKTEMKKRGEKCTRRYKTNTSN